MHFAKPDPRDQRGPKDLSVTAKGGMECLAQTFDIDKTGSQSSCGEVHIHTLPHFMDGRMGGLPKSLLASNMHILKA